MRMAIHPEGRLVDLNDLHHVQGIERRRERAALVFGVGIDDRCIMADFDNPDIAACTIGFGLVWLELCRT